MVSFGLISDLLVDTVWRVELLSPSAPLMWTGSVWPTQLLTELWCWHLLSFQLTKIPFSFHLREAISPLHVLQNRCFAVPGFLCSVVIRDNINNLHLLKTGYFCLTGFPPRFVFGFILNLFSSLSLLFLPIKKEICIFHFYPCHVQVSVSICILASP